MSGAHQDKLKAPALSKQGKENHGKINWSKRAEPKKKKNTKTVANALPKERR